VKLGVPLDFNKLEGQNFRFHVLASAPSSPVTGQAYYNSGDLNVYIWDGSGWVDLTTQGTTAPDADASTKGLIQLAGDLAGTAASPQIATGVIVNADINAGAAIALSKLATDPLARANHTGTQLAATISDFDTQVRTSRLDQMAAPTAAVGFNSQRITGLTDPSGAQDAATKNYVDNSVAGLKWKAPVRVASTASITINPGGTTLTIDGVALANGDRVLLKDQSTASQNGIYLIGGIGTSVSTTRTTDADTAAELDGAAVLVEEGTANSDTQWVLTTNAPITLGTTGLTFSHFGGTTAVTAGLGLVQNGNALDVNVDASSIEINADTLRVKAAGITNAMLAGSIDLTTKVTGALPIGNGGTGQTTAKLARESGLGSAGYYSSATHGASATITITQATHGLRASRGLLVQVQEEASGDVVIANVSVASSGDVTVVFAASQSANTIRVTIIG
jgi:hypothetical protein